MLYVSRLYLPAAELATNHSYSIERARVDLGYQPAVNHTEGLARFYPWAQEHLL